MVLQHVLVKMLVGQDDGHDMATPNPPVPGNPSLRGSYFMSHDVILELTAGALVHQSLEKSTETTWAKKLWLHSAVPLF